MEKRFERYWPDMKVFHHKARTRPCFVWGAERMYLYTFGSNQGIAHVHWHVVPLPPGAPYEEQQGAWASWGKGVLDIPQEEMALLAARIGARMG